MVKIKTDINYYKILEVQNTANEDEIKNNYRKLVHIYHPDKTKGDKTKEEIFKTLAEAYGVLSDKEKRKEYDSFIKLGGDGDFTTKKTKENYQGDEVIIVNESKKKHKEMLDIRNKLDAISSNCSKSSYDILDSLKIIVANIKAYENIFNIYKETLVQYLSMLNEEKYQHPIIEMLCSWKDRTRKSLMQALEFACTEQMEGLLIDRFCRYDDANEHIPLGLKNAKFKNSKKKLIEDLCKYNKSESIVSESFQYVGEYLDLEKLLAEDLSKYKDASDEVGIAIKNANSYTAKKILVEDLVKYKSNTRNVLINSIQYAKDYEDLQILLIKRFLKYNDEDSKKLYIKAIESVNSYSTMKLLIDEFDNYKNSITLEDIVRLLNAIKYDDLLEEVLVKIINYLNNREINILLKNLLNDGVLEKFNTVIKSAILKIMGDINKIKEGIIDKYNQHTKESEIKEKELQEYKIEKINENMDISLKNISKIELEIKVKKEIINGLKIRLKKMQGSIEKVKLFFSSENYKLINTNNLNNLESEIEKEKNNIEILANELSEEKQEYNIIQNTKNHYHNVLENLSVTKEKLSKLEYEIKKIELKINYYDTILSKLYNLQV